MNTRSSRIWHLPFFSYDTHDRTSIIVLEFRAFVPPLLTDVLFIYIIPDRKSTVMYEALSLICESGLIFSIEIPGPFLPQSIKIIYATRYRTKVGFKNTFLNTKFENLIYFINTHGNKQKLQ